MADRDPTSGSTSGDAGTSGSGEGSEGDADARSRVSGGLKQGLGAISAFKDALEETIQEARDRGDLSAERAREIAQRGMERAREAAGDARERFDFVTSQELEDLVERVNEIGVRLENLERRVPQDPSAGPARESGHPGGGEA